MQNLLEIFLFDAKEKKIKILGKSRNPSPALTMCMLSLPIDLTSDDRSKEDKKGLLQLIMLV